MASNKIDNAQNAANSSKELLNNVAENFTSIFSIKPMAKYLSGARCTLRVNGKIVGFAFGISWKVSTEVTEIRTVDDYFPYELAPKQISVDGSITGFRIPGQGPGVQLMQADALSFLHQRYIEIEVKDSQTDNLIFLTKQAMVTNRSENVKSNALSEITLEFKAIGWADERKPEYLENSSAEDQEALKKGLDLSNPKGAFFDAIGGLIS